MEYDYFGCEWVKERGGSVCVCAIHVLAYGACVRVRVSVGERAIESPTRVWSYAETTQINCSTSECSLKLKTFKQLLGQTILFERNQKFFG